MRRLNVQTNRNKKLAYYNRDLKKKIKKKNVKYEAKIKQLYTSNKKTQSELSKITKQKLL